jgi:hypothetical protein
LSKDISSILAGWEHDSDDLQVRIVAGDDGRDKIQMRIDLGLIQMELEGRPDGTRPDGADSLLEACETLASEAKANGEEYELDSKTCGELMREGLQYYHRYLASFHLRRFDLVARDTERNLRLFAFVVRHASREHDKLQFDRYRPYVTMIRSRALAHQALGLEDHIGALAAIDDGIAGIRRFLSDYDRAEDQVDCPELGFLLRWRREVERERPVGPVERLEHQLSLAVTLEDYEEAARVRDQLQRLKGSGIGSRP